jgi:hypothetical protein
MTDWPLARLFRFTFERETFYLLHQTLGEPQGMLNGVDMHQSMVLFTPGRGKIEALAGFCNRLIKDTDARDPSLVRVYQYKRRWKQQTLVLARPLETVVLPAETKARVVADMDEFLDLGTQDWYASHGIPYKRSFLFHGIPGSGKTSLIQAL